MNRRSMTTCHVSLDQTPQDERCVIYTFGLHRRVLGIRLISPCPPLCAKTFSQCRTGTYAPPTVILLDYGTMSTGSLHSFPKRRMASEIPAMISTLGVRQARQKIAELLRRHAMLRHPAKGKVVRLTFE